MAMQHTSLRNGVDGLSHADPQRELFTWAKWGVKALIAVLIVFATVLTNVVLTAFATGWAIEPAKSTEVKALELKVDGLSEDLKSVKQGMETLKSDIADIKTDIAVIAVKIGQLKLATDNRKPQARTVVVKRSLF